MDRKIELYKTCEWKVKGSASGQLPWAEVRQMCKRKSQPGIERETLQGEERESCQEEEIKILHGFWVGENTYCIRFYPQKTGVYWYKIHGNEEEEGTIQCDSTGRFKGMVQTEGTHFVYENQEWFYPFGTTVYALLHQPEQLIEQTMQTLKAAPFNKIRMCVFPKHFDYNHNEPELFAFEKDEDGGWDIHRPCLEFWDRMEERIRELDGMGIQCDLILLHPYDRWGFAALTREQVRVYLEYAVRRLAACPNIWWSLANEYDIMQYTMEDWKYFARIIRENDPYGHLLSNHNMIIPWDFSNPDTTHICLQLKNVDDISRTITQYQKPLMADECCYEGNIPFEWGNISAFELVNRFWKVCAQGGYASHGETFLDEKDVLWWSKGGILKGESPDRIRFLRKILESLPGPLSYAGHDLTREEVEWMQKNPPEEMKNSPFAHLAGKITWEQTHQMMLDGKVFAGHYEEEVYLYYYARHCVAEAVLDLPEDGEYRIEVLDVWDMTRTMVTEKGKGEVKVRLPGKEGMAVLALRGNSSGFN